jgi:hypothetical protein
MLLSIYIQHVFHVLYHTDLYSDSPNILGFLVKLLSHVNGIDD